MCPVNRRSLQHQVLLSSSLLAFNQLGHVSVTLAPSDGHKP